MTPRPFEPVTAAEAAARLDRSTGTIYSWVTRFNARRLGRINRVMYYDLNDLRVIEREIRHGHTVPATDEARAAIADGCHYTHATCTTAAEPSRTRTRYPLLTHTTHGW